MTDGRFFQATGKGGEIQILKDELNHHSKDKKKEALKKVIQGMTIGNDVSPLFPDVVNCMQTNDPTLKKLVYLYVINYAKAQPDLAILAVHTFRKDANDQHNPLLRALAVRTMGCIRLEQMTEYLLEPLRKCCGDTDAYVRKTAAICIAKLYDINPEQVEEQGFVEILRDMLIDSNPMVVVNAVAALCEISTSSGRNYLQLNEELIMKLLPALNECTEWGQIFILDALAMFDPPTPRVAEKILGLHEPQPGVMVRLSHANSAVVLSAIKVMVKYMDRITSREMVRTLCKKVTPPLVTLLSSEPEIQYVVMRNISLIVQKQPYILQNDVRSFICKYNDPLYVKLEKIEVMVQLANDQNITKVLDELKDGASEVDIDCVRKSVQAIGHCAIRLERAAVQCVDCLLELIKTHTAQNAANTSWTASSQLVQEAIIVIKDIFRKYPGRYEDIIRDIFDSLSVYDEPEPEAKSSMIWIIGEYAERIDNSAELLASFLESFHEEPAVVQQQLLTATVKLYLKCTNTPKDLVHRVFKAATEECNNPDLRDRGYMYWRLLTSDPEMAKQVVLSERPTIADDSFACQPRILDRLVSHIGTLASVYHALPETFIVSSKAKEPEAGETNGEENEEDRIDVARVQDEMRNQSRGGDQYVEDSDSGSDSGGSMSSSASGSGSDRGGGGRKRGGGAGADAAPPEPLRPPTVVLGEQTAGQAGHRGLRVAAALVRGRGGTIGLRLTLGNFTSVTMGAFAIQVNKNAFGLAPSATMQVPDLAPNATANTILELVPNRLQSGAPPGMPLYLECAIKCSLDVFYFGVHYDLSTVLTHQEPVNKEVFRETWQRINGGQHATLVGQASQRLTSEMVLPRLQQYFMQFVVSREAPPSSDFLYLSTVTTNNLAIFCELGLQRNGAGIQLAVCTEVPQLIPLFQSFMSEVLQVKWQNGPGAA